MATVTLNYPDLVKLLGKDISLDTIRENLFELGLETEEVNGDEVTFEVTSDRADLLSEEGIAMMLRAYYGIQTGLILPSIKKSDYRLIVEPGIEKVRPYVTGAIVKNVHFTDESIKSIMHLQEKLHGTFGRKRKKGAIGVHDLGKITGKDIIYRAIDRDAVKFVPLQSDMLMTPAEVLEKHPKGKDYRYVLEDKEKVPVIYDGAGLFSFPPIINSKRTEVNMNTTELLIELTGEDQRTIDYMLNIVLYSLHMRGAEIYSMSLEYPGNKTVKPDFTVRSMRMDTAYINSILGLSLSSEEIKVLLERMGSDVSDVTKDGFTVHIPPYRTDILHKRDVSDDVGRVYGFNNITPMYPNTPSVGKITLDNKLADAVRDSLIGLGCQDTLNFMLIGKDENFDKMNLPDEGYCVELSNPYAEQYNVVRTWVAPSLMIVLSNNLHREYPQNIFEVGKVARIDDSKETGVQEEDHAACALCYAKAGYNEAKAKLQSVCNSFGLLDKLRTVPKDYPSMIPGRSAEVFIGEKKAGMIGEIHPEVLKKWGIEMPVALFEIEVAALKN